MAELLYQNKLTLEGPGIDYEPRITRFETASYSVRAIVGLHGVTERLNLVWTGLTAAESRALQNQLKGALIDVVTFTPPPFTDSRAYTAESFNEQRHAGNTDRYTVTATMRREYDPLS